MKKSSQSISKYFIFLIFVQLFHFDVHEDVRTIADATIEKDEVLSSLLKIVLKKKIKFKKWSYYCIMILDHANVREVVVNLLCMIFYTKVVLSTSFNFLAHCLTFFLPILLGGVFEIIIDH